MLSRVSNFIGNALPSDLFTVTELQLHSINSFQQVTSISGLYLYQYQDRSTVKYPIVIHLTKPTIKYMRVCLMDSRDDAEHIFGIYLERLIPIIEASPGFASTASKLSDLCSKVRQSDSKTSVFRDAGPAHLCVMFRFKQVLQESHPVIESRVNSQDVKNCTPLHYACRDEKNACPDEYVELLLKRGADPSVRDGDGLTPVHYAAQHSPSKLKLMTRTSTPAVEMISAFGETPVHLACKADQLECLGILLSSGATSMITESYKYPIHCAVQANRIKCAELLCSHNPANLSVKDDRYGGTALHWARDKVMVRTLATLGASLDATSNSGDTPLHIMQQQDRRECVLELLNNGANPSKPNNQGDTPLHLALPTDDARLVRLILVYGADVNHANKDDMSPRHVAATINKPNSPQMLRMLHTVGAKRCRPGRAGCMDGCSAEGLDDGMQDKALDEELEARLNLYDDLLVGPSRSGHNLVGLSPNKISPRPAGHRVLCMDGGGIRGLTLALTLMKLEEELGGNIRDYFDWIVGTSTGGILSLALANGRSPRYCLGLYFRLKNQVFQGSLPYDTSKFEECLKEEFGSHRKMTEINCGPDLKVILTAVVADRFPPDLHLFKNYVNPIEEVIPHERRFSTAFPLPPKPEETFMWEAARSSGAAPVFFTSSQGRFIDGGLMANNPTLDTLTEIQEYNRGLTLAGREHDVKPVSLLLSLGTGRQPQLPVDTVDIRWPSGPLAMFNVYKGVVSMGRIAIEQATQSEGRQVDRARAWCSMANIPFYRFSPPLSSKIELDETDDDKLIQMCWEALVFLHVNSAKLRELAQALRDLNSIQRS